MALTMAVAVAERVARGWNLHHRPRADDGLGGMSFFSFRSCRLFLRHALGLLLALGHMARSSLCPILYSSFLSSLHLSSVRPSVVLVLASELDWGYRLRGVGWPSRWGVGIRIRRDTGVR